jgi:hypothetical protein
MLTKLVSFVCWNRIVGSNGKHILIIFPTKSLLIKKKIISLNWPNDIQHDDTQHNDTQDNDIQHDDIQHNTNKIVTLTIIMQCRVLLY